MNREIKFRAWDKEKMNYFDLVDTWYNATNFDRKSEIMQYTGLKDKNGKEIYEKDIIKTSPKNKVVEFNHFHNEDFFCKTSDFIGFVIKDIEDCEVLGNIYENPHLLENNE